MRHFSQQLGYVLNIAMMVVLVLIPCGLAYQSIKAYQFLKTCQDPTCGSNIGILYFILIPAEIYLLLMWLLLRYLRKKEMNQIIKFVLLTGIFILGAVPGILLLYPAFLQE